MSIGFKDAHGEFNTTTAHSPHRLALPRLLEILTNLLEPDSPSGEQILKWNRDPEEFDFRFLKSDGEGVLFEVYQYPTDERELAERALVFAHFGNVHEVCAAFAETFQQLYEDRETDEFEFNWRQPFPLVAYDRFRKTLGK
jgi:hypothetical protein